MSETDAEVEIALAAWRKVWSENAPCDHRKAFRAVIAAVTAARETHSAEKQSSEVADVPGSRRRLTTEEEALVLKSMRDSGQPSGEEALYEAALREFGDFHNADGPGTTLKIAVRRAVRNVVALLTAPRKVGEANPDKCARCGFPRKEHSYNGACYGLCGEFVAHQPSPSVGEDKAVRSALQAMLDLHGKPHREEWINNAGFEEAKAVHERARLALLSTSGREGS